MKGRNRATVNQERKTGTVSGATLVKLPARRDTALMGFLERLDTVFNRTKQKHRTENTNTKGACPNGQPNRSKVKIIRITEQQLLLSELRSCVKIEVAVLGFRP